MQRLLYFTIFIFSLLTYFPTHAEQRFCDRADVKAYMQELQTKYQFSPTYLARIFKEIKFNPEVIAKMKVPYEAKPWAFYRNFFITPDRIQEGINFYKKYKDILALEEKTYGIPANVIVAIIGIETRYGKEMGSYRILDTLATLGFDDKPRQAYFRYELGQYLILARQYHYDPLTLMGSRSGAMGLCQFMPSSYLLYAISFDKKNPPNLFTTPADAIFSAGQFLAQSGWIRNQPITTPVKATGSGYYEIEKQQGKAIVEPHMSLARFEKYGIQPAGIFAQNIPAYLIGLNGEKGEEFWLGFHNFYTITRYNNSNLYAMAIYQFAQEIEAKYQQESRTDLNKAGLMETSKH